MESEDIKELVIARLKTIPDDVGVSVGSEGNFKISDLIKHIEQGDELGKKMIEIEMNFLQALKEGLLYESHPGNEA